MMMLMFVDFRMCMRRHCCSKTTWMGRRSRASSRHCTPSATSFLDHMANGDGNWRMMSTRWNYLVAFRMMTRSWRSLERTMRRSMPTWCSVWLDCCYSSLSAWKCRDLSMRSRPTVLEPFQHWALGCFGNSVVRRHLQAQKKLIISIMKNFRLLLSMAAHLCN